MANRACSTIRRISIISNSVRGFNFLNWHKVYNVLVIPVLTYGASVWYTGVRQKGLVQCLQVAQNNSIRKITGVFCTTPIEPLHNMMGIPPISYMLPKLIHAYTLRLQGLPPRAKVKTVLEMDQCRYWPEYITPPHEPQPGLFRAQPLHIPPSQPVHCQALGSPTPILQPSAAVESRYPVAEGGPHYASAQPYFILIYLTYNAQHSPHGGLPHMLCTYPTPLYPD